jgi:aldose 1-epimerase
VLGYEDLDSYRTGGGSIGVTVGRYANRIAGGTFTLNGALYDVGRNEKDYNHLHGGTEGFQAKNWAVKSVEENAFTLQYVSQDGEMGYPGTVTVSVRVAVEDNTLQLAYTAVSDKDTVINLTNHAYFNLNGYNGGDVLNTQLQIFADAITPINEKLIPTGELMCVENTPLDFRTMKPIGQDIHADHEQLRFANGYDHNFVLKNDAQKRLAVTAVSPESGIRMECYTDQPGVQLYTANFLNTAFGKGGPMYQYQGFCLETQHFPDSPHHDNFPTTVLKAGETFNSITEYAFSK